MNGWRGMLAGTLGLAILYRVVAVGSSPGGASRIEGLLGVPGSFARRFLSPDVPALGPVPTAAKPTDTKPVVAAVAGSGGTLADRLRPAPATV